MGIPDHLTCLFRNLYAGQEATLELDMEQRACSKLGKEYDKAVYCHATYLTSMQSTSCKMPGWMNHKLESRLTGKGVGEGFRIGDTYIPMAYSCQCMAKTTTIL